MPPLRDAIYLRVMHQSLSIACVFWEMLFLSSRLMSIRGQLSLNLNQTVDLVMRRTRHLIKRNIKTFLVNHKIGIE